MLISLQLTSDARLVRRVLGGRRDDFGVLVERYYGAVQSVARARLENSVDAEDVVQEAFVSAYSKLDTLMEPHKFGPWVMAIARNAAVSWIRRRKSEVLVADVATVEPPGEVPPVERAELQRIVRAKLQEMDPEQREILILFYYGGKSVGEVASLLDISKEAANKRLQRAREALGTEFLKSVGEERKAVDSKRARRAVMAAVAAAPVVWQTKAAAAGSAALLAVKALIGALAVVLVGTGVVVGVKLAQTVPEEPTAAVQQREPASRPKATEAPAEAVAPAVEQAADATGTCRIEVILLDGDSEQPVGNAEVVAEMVAWGPREMPPQTTVRKTGKADSHGKAVFENLPIGCWCVTAVTSNLCGVNDYEFRADKLSGTLRVWMRPRASVSGRLTGPDGTPVPGAVIYPVKHILMPGEVLGHSEVAGVRQTTGSDGSFSFPSIFPGAWQFYVLPPNLPPTITDYKMLEGGLNLTLEPSGSLAGRVVDAATGEARDRVVIRAYQGDMVLIRNPSAPREDRHDDYGGRVSVETESGADGSFRLANLAPGKYKIESGDAELLNTSPDAEFEVQSDAETTAEVRVSVGGTILGRVYNRETGESLPGLRVETMEGNSQAITDANGEYMLTGLKPGSQTVRVAFPTGEEGQFQLSGDRAEMTVAVTYGQVLEHVDIAAKPPEAVKGRVVDRTGAPVAGATVYIVARVFSTETKTSKDGTFVRYLHYSLENLRFAAKKEGWQSETVGVPDSTQEVALTLNVPANGAIYGTAMSAEGKPLVLYSVAAEVLEEGAEEGALTWRSATAKTGTSGEFALENLAAGSYELIVSTPGPGSSEVMKKKMRLAENQVLRNVVVRPEPQGGLTISGRVITPDGGALYGATVGIPGEYPLRTERVESDGRFVVKGLQEQAYTLVASCAGYSPVAVENVEAGTQNLTLKLVRPAVLAGNVTDATTGKPVTVFQLNAFTEPRVESDTITWNVVQTLSNEQGRFDFKNFAAMAVRLFVGAEGYAPWEQTVTLEEGKTSDIAVQLEPGAVVRGAVTDAQGNPVAGAEIMVAPGGAINAFLDPHLARSDANGAFETRALPEGAALKLIAKHPSYARDCVEVVPARANDTEVTFTLQQPGGLEIHALLDGEPMSRCYVQIHGACGPEAYLPQDPTGLVVQGLPPGELEFTAILYPENRAVQQQTLTATVVAGQTTPVEVNFKSPENDAP